MCRVAIFLTDGNLIIAALLLALGTSQKNELIASFEEIFLSFSDEATAKRFVDDKVVRLGCHNSSQKSADVILRPDFAGSENASRAIFHAINAYKDSLKAINRFNLVFLRRKLRTASLKMSAAISRHILAQMHFTLSRIYLSLAIGG